MNSPRSNVKLEGQMNSEFDEFAIHGKLKKRGIPWNQNQVIWNYNKRDTIFKISNFSNWKLGKMKNTKNQFAKLNF